MCVSIRQGKYGVRSTHAYGASSKDRQMEKFLPGLKKVTVITTIKISIKVGDWGSFFIETDLKLRQAVAENVYPPIQPSWPASCLSQSVSHARGHSRPDF